MEITAKLQNFVRSELQCKCGCGLVNITDEALISLQAFRYYLNRRYKRDIPIIITSACRCQNHNSRVGSTDTSEHQGTTKQSTAFDIVSPALNFEDLYFSAVDSKLFSTVIKYNKMKFVHVDTRQRPDFGIENWEWDR